MRLGFLKPMVTKKRAGGRKIETSKLKSRREDGSQLHDLLVSNQKRENSDASHIYCLCRVYAGYVVMCVVRCCVVCSLP